VRVAELEGDNRRAYGLLREAIALDSGFAMAWRKLASVAANIEDLGTARLASERAFEYRERLPDRERYLTMGSYYTNADRPRDALRAYAAHLELYPHDVRALFNTGFVYEQLRDYRRAEEYRRRARSVDSTIAQIHWNLASDLLNQGKLDAAAAQVRSALQRFPGLERALWLDVDIAIARGALDVAERRSRELLAEAGKDYVREDRARRTLAALALMRGRVREAERHLRDLEPALRREGSASERVTLAAWRGFVASWFRKSGSQAIALMEQSLGGLRLDTVPVPDRHNAWRGYVYALAGPARPCVGAGRRGAAGAGGGHRAGWGAAADGRRRAARAGSRR
jgi:tetratricopeptide (TPR) repeat protein